MVPDTGNETLALMFTEKMLRDSEFQSIPFSQMPKQGQRCFSKIKSIPFSSRFTSFKGLNFCKEEINAGTKI